MPTYISLVSWTQKGIENVRESPNRLDAAKKLFQANGGELKQFYLVFGQYDMVVISEFPDDESATRAAITSNTSATMKGHRRNSTSFPLFHSTIRPTAWICSSSCPWPMM